MSHVREFIHMPPCSGEMGDRIRTFDWAGTPCGHTTSWSPPLHTALNICLASDQSAALYWGKDHRLFYNDGWMPLAGDNHPAALGLPAGKAWGEHWPRIAPALGDVLASGCGCRLTDFHLPVARNGRLEECYWDHCLTPVLDEAGDVAGILNHGIDVTDRVFGHQRHELLIDLGDRMRAQESEAAVIGIALEAIGRHLGVARAGFGEVDLTAGRLEIAEDWRRNDHVRSLRGAYPLGGFGAALHAAMRTGATVSTPDTQVAGLPDGQVDAALYTRLGIRAGLVVPVLKNGEYCAAIFVHDDRPRAWTRHHETLLAGVAERIWQESRRVRADHALRASEARHRLIFEQANDIIFTADLDQLITGANPAACEALGQPPAELIGRSIADFVDPAEFARTTAMLRRKLVEGGTTRYEVAVQAGGGRIRQWEISSTLARDDAGDATGLHAIARDVSERHALETHQARLINELNHRVKNMLALVQGLAQTSFRGDRDPAEAQAAFQARLAALAAAHDLLTHAKWEGAALDAIVAAALAPCPNPSRIVTGGPPIAVAPKTAVSLVMAFHELASNAMRHGALVGDDGRLEVTWDRFGDDRLSIVWRERGGPVTSPPSRRGFGLRMVERALAAELAATVSLEFPPEGFVCTIDAPLPAAVAAPMPALAS